MLYLIIKSLHLISVISWMVGLLYLPRIYVYHSDKKKNTELDTTFLIMEHRLFNYIMNPAMLLTYLFGFILIYENIYLLDEVYFLIKITLVGILTIFHIYLYILYKDFKRGYRNKRKNFYRIINEFPTILMIVIIVLIYVKPDLNNS